MKRWFDSSRDASRNNSRNPSRDASRGASRNNSRDAVSLIALDLDGTTLTRGHITPRTRRALEAAIQQGIQVAVATGRVYSALPKDVFRIRGLRYVITSNGAQITDLSGGQVIYENYIQVEPLKAVAALLRSLPHPIEVFTDGAAYNDVRVYADLKRADSVYAGYMSRSYVLRTRKPVAHIHDFLDDHIDKVENINIYFANSQQKERTRKLLLAIPSITITSSTSHNLEVGGATTSKASGLSHLCQLIGCDMGHVMACGDSPNDMAMLAEVGLSVAMENGEPEVKAMADVIAPSNEEEGVAFAVEQFALGRTRPAWQLHLLRRKNRAAYGLRQCGKRIKRWLKKEK